MKKGFTLVELLAIIVVMGIIATIGGMAVSGVIDTAKQKSYDQQINNIIKAAKEWSVENTEKLPDSEGSSEELCVSLSQLKESGKLSGIPEDPRTGNVMNGCVTIAYDYNNNQYTYIYQELASSIQYVITNDTTYPWTNYNGLYMSTNRYDNTKSNLTFSFTLTEPATLSFDWSVSSESEWYDYISYSIYKDGNATELSGKIGGQGYGGPASDSEGESNIYNPNSDSLIYATATKKLEAGTYQVIFTYRKDSSVSKGYDAGFVKNFSISY